MPETFFSVWQGMGHFAQQAERPLPESMGEVSCVRESCFFGGCSDEAILDSFHSSGAKPLLPVFIIAQGGFRYNAEPARSYYAILLNSNQS